MGSAAALIALNPALRCVQDRLALADPQSRNGRPPAQLRRTLHKESIARPRPHRSESIQHRLKTRPDVSLLDQIPLPLWKPKPSLRPKFQGQQLTRLAPRVDGPPRQ